VLGALRELLALEVSVDVRRVLGHLRRVARVRGVQVHLGLDVDGRAREGRVHRHARLQ
jgi:hypothetical protein